LYKFNSVRAKYKIGRLLVLLTVLAGVAFSPAALARARWSEQAAQAWYGNQPWVVGSNYIPASAINQLEMWQADTFDPQRIDLELGWAESLGMNTMRVFLHDLLWQQDSRGLTQRIDAYLTISDRHHIKTLFVLFDSVWDPSPHLGLQHAPVPGIHNSGWVQSPGAVTFADPGEYPRLKAYVTGVVGAFAHDARILGWDVWNEPTVEGSSDTHFAGAEAPHKAQRVATLLPQVFEWARSMNPIQPLTSGVWKFEPSTAVSWPGIARIQIAESDILSFHTYDSPDEVRRRILSLQGLHRPILCTEYMARSNGSTFQNTMPILKEYHVGAINWGLVAGKTQTYFPWDSWDRPYLAGEPTPWFHDVFRADGRPYDPEEIRFIREILNTDTAPGQPAPTARAADQSSPATSNVPGAPTPGIHPDLSITFTLKAPDARTVQVAGGDGLGAGPFPMTKDAEGIWSVTTPPAVPGFHYYWFVLDGVSVSDPSSQSYFGYGKETSGVEVPEPGADHDAITDVPHGEVRAKWYLSKTTGEWRRALVYTPPGYDRDPQTRYPVLILQHGAGEDETGWTRQGRAQFILDNLIAAGKARPMIVVMDRGYATRVGMPAVPVGPGAAPEKFKPAFSAFEDVIIHDLIPTIDASYRTIPDREHRAMAGLSVGGMETLFITLRHLDTFAYIGSMSGPIVPDLNSKQPLGTQQGPFDTKTAYEGAFSNPSAFNSRVKLLWLGVGTAEPELFRSGIGGAVLALKAAGMRLVYFESNGTAHEWQTWRRDLNDFAPRLFR
jgi:enterochelin esterase-like enzyme